MRVLPSHALSVLFAFLTIITPAIMYNQLSNAQDELQIRNKLALYAYAVDDKQFDLFDQIFTADTNAIYSDAPADQLKGVCLHFTFHTYADLVSLPTPVSPRTFPIPYFERCHACLHLRSADRTRSKP